MGTLVNTGDTVLVSQHNPALQDISAALSGSLDRDGKGGMRANLNMGGHRITNAAPGTSPNDLATVSQASVPIGGVLDYAGTVAPDGYLMCYGQAVSRVDYSTLYAVIGTQYGTGNGTTTFNVPDARGRTTAGKDDMGGAAAGRLTSPVAGSTLGATGGSQSHTLTTSELAAHSHTGTTENDGVHRHSLGGWVGGRTDAGGSPGSLNVGTASSEMTDLDGAHTHNFTTGQAGGGAAHNNTQPTIVFNKIIRAGNS